MKIEPAQIMDASSIVKINIQEWQNTYQGIFPNSFLASLKEKEDQSIEKCQKKIKEYIVCKMGNKIVGFLRFGPNRKNYDNTYAEIYALYIAKNYQQQGIGKALIDYTFKILKSHYKYVLISISRK